MRKTSPYAQRRKGFTVEPLRQQDARGRWEDLVVEDKRSTPAEIAACRLDVRAWMRRLNPRRRAVALRLGGGETTKGAAQHFGLTPARISQYRQELRNDWDAFQGERVAAAA
jgi:transposase-like protein